MGSFDINEAPAAALNLVARQAELWGADWETVEPTVGKLGLPVTAGLCRGWIEGEVRAEALGPGKSRIVFEEKTADYRIDRASVMILVAAALGSLLTVVALFVPRLLPVLPMGILLAFGAYLVVIARLQNSGPEEFFGTVVDDASPE